MPTPEFLQHHSTYFENLLEHRFLFDLGRELVLRNPPKLLGILKAQVDMDGVDLTLTCGGQIRNIQMKTRSKAPLAKPYNISEALWVSPEACVLWMIYDPKTLNPISYYLLECPQCPREKFRASDRKGYRKLFTRNANHKNYSIQRLAEVLFPQNNLV